jgi:hypothetical protein
VPPRPGVRNERAIKAEFVAQGTDESCPPGCPPPPQPVSLRRVSARYEDLHSVPAIML